MGEKSGVKRVAAGVGVGVVGTIHNEVARNTWMCGGLPSNQLHPGRHGATYSNTQRWEMVKVGLIHTIAPSLSNSYAVLLQPIPNRAITDDSWVEKDFVGHCRGFNNDWGRCRSEWGLEYRKGWSIRVYVFVLFHSILIL